MHKTQKVEVIVSSFYFLFLKYNFNHKKMLTYIFIYLNHIRNLIIILLNNDILFKFISKMKKI